MKSNYLSTFFLENVYDPDIVFAGGPFECADYYKVRCQCKPFGSQAD